jgi:hypothetical protein
MADEKSYICISFLNKETNKFQIENVPIQDPNNFEENMREVKKHFENRRYSGGGVIIEDDSFKIMHCYHQIDTLNSAQFKALNLEEKITTRFYTGEAPPASENCQEGAAKHHPMVMTYWPSRIKNICSQKLKTKNAYTRRDNNYYQESDLRADKIIGTFCAYYDPKKENDGFNQEGLKKAIEEDLKWLKKRPGAPYEPLKSELKFIRKIEAIFSTQEKVWGNNHQSTHYKPAPQPTPTVGQTSTPIINVGEIPNSTLTKNT